MTGEDRAMGPIKLRPIYRESIWAGERLKSIRGLAGAGIGISREVSTYPGSVNQIEGGPWDGKAMTDVIKSHRDQIMGDVPGEQLVRVAFMDAAEELSVQVHPDQERAVLWGDQEKSEAWYIVEAKEGATITAGIDTEDMGMIKKAIEEQRLDELLISIPVKAGDMALIPAGMVHACGKDMLVVEVGSFGGITCRLYDHGRGRRLDLEKGLAVLKPWLRCQVGHTPLEITHHPKKLVRYGPFQADIVDVHGIWRYGGNSSYRILTCVLGDCQIRWEEESYHLGYTDTILLPAACRGVRIEGDARVLISYGRPDHEERLGQSGDGWGRPDREDG